MKNVLNLTLRLCILLFWFLHLYAFWLTGSTSHSPQASTGEIVVTGEQGGLFGAIPYYSTLAAPGSHAEIYPGGLVFGIIYSILVTLIFYFAWIGAGQKLTNKRA